MKDNIQAERGLSDSDSQTKGESKKISKLSKRRFKDDPNYMKDIRDQFFKENFHTGSEINFLGQEEIPEDESPKKILDPNQWNYTIKSKPKKNFSQKEGSFTKKRGRPSKSEMEMKKEKFNDLDYEIEKKHIEYPEETYKYSGMAYNINNMSNDIVKRSDMEFLERSKRMTALEYLSEIVIEDYLKNPHIKNSRLPEISSKINKKKIKNGSSRKTIKKDMRAVIYSSDSEFSDNIDRKSNRRPYKREEDENFPYTFEKGERVYSCPQQQCPKTFPSLSRIRRHYIIHTGFKPYTCMSIGCGKSFSRKDNMLQHFKNHCQYLAPDEFLQEKENFNQ